MPTKIPSIGSSNWGSDLNKIFNDVTVTTSGTNFLTKPTPGTDYATAQGGFAKIDPRSIAAGNLTLYVAPTGVDTNDGLTAGTAKKSIKAAVDVANTIQFGGYTITIEVAAGTYTMPTIADAVVVRSRNIVKIKGMGAAQANNTISAGPLFDDYMFRIYSETTVENFDFRSNTNNSAHNVAVVSTSGLWVEDATLKIIGCTFNDISAAVVGSVKANILCSGFLGLQNINYAFLAQSLSIITCSTTAIIMENTGYGFTSNNDSTVSVLGGDVQFNNSPSYADLATVNKGTIRLNNLTSTVMVGGNRFINGNGGLVEVLNSACTIVTGGNSIFCLNRTAVDINTMSAGSFHIGTQSAANYTVYASASQVYIRKAVGLNYNNVSNLPLAVDYQGIIFTFNAGSTTYVNNGTPTGNPGESLGPKGSYIQQL